MSLVGRPIFTTALLVLTRRGTAPVTPGTGNNFPGKYLYYWQFLGLRLVLPFHQPSNKPRRGSPLQHSKSLANVGKPRGCIFRRTDSQKTFLECNFSSRKLYWGCILAAQCKIPPISHKALSRSYRRGGCFHRVSRKYR